MIAHKQTEVQTLQNRFTRRHAVPEYPPDLSQLPPYVAFEHAALGHAQALLSRDKKRIDAWAEVRDAAAAQCALTGVFAE